MNLKLILTLFFSCIIFGCSKRDSLDAAPELDSKIVYDCRTVDEDDLKNYNQMPVDEFAKRLGYYESQNYFEEGEVIYIVGQKKLLDDLSILVFFYEGVFNAHLLSKEGRLGSNLCLSNYSKEPYYQYHSEIDESGVVHIVEDKECFTTYNDFEVQDGSFVNVDFRYEKKDLESCLDAVFVEEYDPR